MANLFGKSSNNNNNKSNKLDISTRSFIPATCVAMVTAIVENKYAKDESDANMPVIKYLFFAKTGAGETISKWSPWLKIMSLEKATNEKSNYMKLFDGDEVGELSKKDVVENVLDTDWMFKQKWQIQGVKGKNDYINIGTIAYDGEADDTAMTYDLEGYAPFNTIKYFGKVYPIHEMYVRLAGGECHKVEEPEFRTWEEQVKE